MGACLSSGVRDEAASGARSTGGKLNLQGVVGSGKHCHRVLKQLGQGSWADV